MPRSRLSTLILVAGMTLAGLSSSAVAGLRLDYPDQFPGPPYYATVAYIEGEPITPVVFYHDPAAIPADSNLLGLDPRAWSDPLLMDGFLVFADQNFTVPTHQELHGSATPIWFVETAALEAIAADGVVTLAELEGLNPVKGITTRYVETVHFIGGTAVPFAEVQSTGVLEDGSTYSMHLTEAWLPPDDEHVIIHYELNFD